jgi:glycosyltransferase involved in cell wall biosynthesis
MLTETPLLRSRAIFLGEQDPAAMGLWYGLADAVLLPSRREACPLTAIEAARATLPILASDVGGVGEIVRDGSSGLLFPVEDADSFAAALRRLLDPAQRRSLGVMAREGFLRHHTDRHMAGQILTIYEGLLDEHRAPCLS